MPDRSEWVVKPANTLIVYFGWPTLTVKMSVICWLDKRFPVDNLRVTGQDDDLLARNNAVQVVLREHRKFTDIIFMDDDVDPLPETDQFLCLDADVVGCRYDVPRPEVWSDPRAIRRGLFRCKRKVLETLKPPWFVREYSDDGCRLLKAEIVYFRDKALEAGFSVGAAGWARREIARINGVPQC